MSTKSYITSTFSKQNKQIIKNISTLNNIDLQCNGTICNLTFNCRWSARFRDFAALLRCLYNSCRIESFCVDAFTCYCGLSFLGNGSVCFLEVLTVMSIDIVTSSSPFREASIVFPFSLGGSLRGWDASVVSLAHEVFHFFVSGEGIFP